MKTTIRKVYQCEHCKKNMLNAGSMSRHEHFCKQNPNNLHRCFDFCKHLEKTSSVIEHDEMPLRVTHFTCLKLDKKMYSYKFEKSVGFRPMYISDLERMPLKCDDYEGPFGDDKEIVSTDFNDIDW